VSIIDAPILQIINKRGTDALKMLLREVKQAEEEAEELQA
jgi:hypothetical protein